MIPDFPLVRLRRAGVDESIIDGLRAQFEVSETEDKAGFVGTLAGLGDAEILERYGSVEPEVPVGKGRKSRSKPKTTEVLDEAPDDAIEPEVPVGTDPAAQDDEPGTGSEDDTSDVSEGTTAESQ